MVQPPSDYEDLEIEPLPLPGLDRPRETIDAWLSDLVEGSNALRKLLIYAAHVWPSSVEDRFGRALLGGHVVRLYKLYDTLVFMVVENRGEIALLLGRCIADTLVNLLFLLRFGTAEMYREVIDASLGLEKRLEDEIQGS